MKLSTLRPIVLTISEDILVSEIPLLENKKFHSYIEKEEDQLVFTFGDVTLWVPDKTDKFLIIKAIRVYVKSVSDDRYKISGLMVNTRGVRSYDQKTKREIALTPDARQNEQLKQLVLQKLKERELTANRPSRGNVYDIITNELEKDNIKAMFNQPADISQQDDEDYDPLAWTKTEPKAPSIQTVSEPIPEPEEENLTLPGEEPTQSAVDDQLSDEPYKQPEIDDANEYYNVPGNDFYDNQEIATSDQISEPELEVPAKDDDSFFDDNYDKPEDVDQPSVEMPAMADTDDMTGERPNLTDKIDSAISTTEPEQDISKPELKPEEPQTQVPELEPEELPQPADTAYVGELGGQPVSLNDKIDTALNDRGLDGSSLDMPEPEISKKPEVPESPVMPRRTQPEVKPGTTEVTRQSKPPTTARAERTTGPTTSQNFEWDNADIRRSKGNKDSFDIISIALASNPLPDAQKATLLILKNKAKATKQDKVFEIKENNMNIYKSSKMIDNIENINAWAKKALSISHNLIVTAPDKILIKLP